MIDDHYTGDVVGRIEALRTAGSLQHRGVYRSRQKVTCKQFARFLSFYGYMYLSFEAKV